LCVMIASSARPAARLAAQSPSERRIACG
jgi:hypothetical protein